MNNSYHVPFNVLAGGQARPTRLLARLPAFNMVPVSYNTALKLAEYELGNTTKVSIGRLPDAITENETFVLAIRYLNSAGDVVRFLLHKPDTTTSPLYPMYSGQTIEPAAVIEVWSNFNETAGILSADADIPINVVTFANDQRWCFCLDIVQNIRTLVATVFTSTETGPCNPFCDCLMLAGGGVPTLEDGMSDCMPILRGYGSPEGVVSGLASQWYYDYNTQMFYWHKDTVTSTVNWELHP